MRRFSTFLLTLPLAGCLAGSTATLDPADEPPSGVTTTTSYLRDVQPIVERSCLGCHVEGGVAPFSFEAPEVVAKLAPAIVGAVKGGRMPPFHASAGCNSYARDPRLSAAELALLERWAGEGAPIGDAAEARHAEAIVSPPVRHDISMDIGGDFDAREMAGSDNYRCFAMDPRATRDVMVTGYEVVPGNRALVHHVLAYLVPPAQVAQLTTKDSADPGMGYECFSGGVGIAGAIANQIAGWVPGGGPVRLPEGTGLEVQAGSRIVIQVHYNLLAAKDGVPAMDRTQLHLQTAPAGSLTPARILPAVKRNLSIPAGDPSSVQVAEIPLPGRSAGATVYRLTGHMHLLGKQVKLELLHSDGSTTCLLDIPSWDFQWQREYELTSPVTTRAGDRLKLTCVYDNSAAHQPIVGGMPQPPRNVAWGESSLDEMCMTYVTFTER